MYPIDRMKTSVNHFPDFRNFRVIQIWYNMTWKKHVKFEIPIDTLDN